MKKIYSFMALTAFSAFSYVANAQNELIVGDVKVGDLITLSDGSQWYVGTNEITNGNFDMDPAMNNNEITGWTVGENYAQMTTSNFNWIASGGYDGGAYIQASGHSGAGGKNSVATRWAVEKNTRYYFSFYVSHNSANNQYIPVISLTDQESTGGGQNEDMKIIGMSGDTADGCLGFANYIDEDNDGYGDWCQTACSFESQEYTWLQFNARWLKENKIQACFDGVFLAKLYDPATTTQSMVAYLALQSKLNELMSTAEQYAEYEGIASELSDYAQEGEINGEVFADMTSSTELENLQAAIDAVNAKIEAAKGAIANINSFVSLMESASELFEMETTYPGINAFNNEYSKFDGYANNGYYSLDESISAIEYISVATADLEKAIAAYRFSQEASEENPADYTFYINQPLFISQGKWYIGTSGGDQRIKADATDNEGNPVSCWNAWRNQASFTDNTIQQDLTELPNGYYTVTADMCTQDGCLTDQHVFATSSITTAASPLMTQTGWDPMNWETLKTEKILVVDGKLKIGATSNGSAELPSGFEDYRGGWFCVRNFKLNYLGEASQEDIAAAIANKFADAEAGIESIHYAADKEAYKQSIADAKEASDLDALNAAMNTAKEAEADYEAVTNGTYKELSELIAAEPESNASAVTKAVVDLTTNYINSAAATYKETGKYTEILRYYLNNYIPAINEAEGEIELINNEKGKEVISSTIKSEVAKFAKIQSLPTTADVDESISTIKKAITTAQSSDITIADGSDVTAYIANPTIDDTYATGWTIKKIVGDGNGAKSGQQYDGNGSGFYIDTWNPNGGIRSTWYQVLNVPNGTYTIENLMRASGSGAYIFASDAAPITDEETETLHLDINATNVMTEAVPVLTPAKYLYGEEEAQTKTDTHGELWCAAAEKVMAKLGIEGPTESSSIYDLALELNNGVETCPEGIDETDWAVFSAYEGKGRGWFVNSASIEVKNHTLVVGVTCDYAFVNKTEEDAFTGAWFSADNFKLTLNKVGDNTNWDPTTGITSAVASKSGESAIYNVSGVRISDLQKGINIVKKADGTITKILVK